MPTGYPRLTHHHTSAIHGEARGAPIRGLTTLGGVPVRLFRANGAQPSPIEEGED
jgi:hypothetical protein